VQGASHALPDPFEEQLSQSVDAGKQELADIGTFDTTLAEQASGYGEAIHDPIRRGLARLVSEPETEGCWPHLALAYATGKRRSKRSTTHGSREWLA
jgi:hypothetical protein